MALINPTPPEATTLGFRAGILAFLAGPNFGGEETVIGQVTLAGPLLIPSLADFGPEGPSPHDPQQVFILGLQDLKDSQGGAATKLAGWRYFAGDKPGNTVLGDVSDRQAKGTWTLTSVSYGKRVWEALQASHDLENLPNVLASDYELRFLKIPGLHIEAFWLVSQTGATDLVVVFPATSRHIHRQLNEAVYRIDEFLKIVVSLAEKRLSYPPPMGS